MNHKPIYRNAVVVAALLLAGLSIARADGDPDAGRQLGFTCLGCHGIEGQRNAYPSYRVPRLGGQKPAYLGAALTAYRNGTRPHPTMRAQAGSISDADIEDLVAWIATLGNAADTATAAQVEGVDAAALCVTCHGEQGAGVQPAPPVLAGQHEDYLVQALAAYRDGSRTGTVMNGFAATLDDADIALLARFYARQVGLKTLD